MSRVTKERVARKSLNQRGPQSIAGDKDPDYVYRFVNDTGSRIANFQAAGYEFVQDTDLVVGDSRVLILLILVPVNGLLVMMVLFLT